MSAIVSVLQHLVIEGFRWRSRSLRASIRNLLRDDVYRDDIVKRFFRHPMTASLTGDRSMVTAIEPTTFVTALASAVQPAWSTGDPIESLPASVAALKDGGLKQRLGLVLPPAVADRAEIERRVIAWFASAETKMSEKFKADITALSWGLAVGATVLFNVSAIEIVQRLRSDGELRTAFASVVPTIAPAVYDKTQGLVGVAQAQAGGPLTAVTDTGQAINPHDVGALLTVFECVKGNSDLPVGWPWMADLVQRFRGDGVGLDPCENAVRSVSSDQLMSSLREIQKRAPASFSAAGTDVTMSAPDRKPQYGPTFGRDGPLEVLLGWMITIAAAAQGAPFWFNMLRKVTGR
jgi:hypothetical protein